MNEIQQARLLEIYILSLQHDWDASPPRGLDPDMARFARDLVSSQRVSMLDHATRSRIWEHALTSLKNEEQIPMIQTRTTQTKANFSITWGAVVALFVMVSMGIVMMLNLNKHSPNNYLSVYPLVTETPTTVHDLNDNEDTEATQTTIGELDPNYVTATGFVVDATETAIHAILQSSSSGFLEPTIVSPDLVGIVTSTPVGMVDGEQAQLIRDICQDVEAESAECLYRMGRLYQSFGIDQYQELALNYLRQAYILMPDNVEYRYGLASILFETGECVESKRLLMQNINEPTVLPILASYAMACNETIVLPSGLNIIPPLPTIDPNATATPTPTFVPIGTPLPPTRVVLVTPTTVPVVPSLDSDSYKSVTFDDLCQDVALDSAECAYTKGTFLMYMPAYLEMSLDYLRNAVELAPDDDRYQKSLGYVLAKLGHCEESRAILMQFVDEEFMTINHLMASYAQDCQENIEYASGSRTLFIDRSTLPPLDHTLDYLQLMIARVDIEAGTEIEPDMLITVFWRADDFPEGVFSDASSDLIGGVAVEDISQYQPILSSQISSPE